MKVLKKFQNVPVNIKVEGERKMLRDVMLVPTNTTGVFALRTGSRGRPRLLGQSEIEKIVLADGKVSASGKKPVTKKTETVSVLKNKKSPGKGRVGGGLDTDAPKKRKVVVVRKSSK